MKITSAQMTILHLIFATCIAAIIGAISAATQYYFSHGQDLWLTLVFFGSTLATTFGALRYAVWHAVQSSPALPQAEKDTESQAMQVAQAAMNRIEALLPFIHQHPAPPQPPSGPVVSRAVTTPAARTPQAITFPQPSASATSAPHISFGDTGQMPVVPGAGIQPPQA